MYLTISASIGIFYRDDEDTSVMKLDIIGKSKTKEEAENIMWEVIAEDFEMQPDPDFPDDITYQVPLDMQWEYGDRGYTQAEHKGRIYYYTIKEVKIEEI